MTGHAPQGGKGDGDRRAHPEMIGTDIPKVAQDFDLLLARGTTRQGAEEALRRRNDTYNPAVLAVLRKVEVPQVANVVKTVPVAA